jgi:hypothetical protein
VKIQRCDDHTISIGPLDLLCCELLNQIRVSAIPDDTEAVRERLFPSPTHGEDEEFDEEWREYVDPELRHLFESSLETIQSDLEDFPPKTPAEEGHTLKIPVDHLEAWVHGLNQARLAIAARNGFGEEEMDDGVPFGGDGRALALFQVHFYGFLQECFLRLLGEP